MRGWAPPTYEAATVALRSTASRRALPAPAPARCPLSRRIDTPPTMDTPRGEASLGYPLGPLGHILPLVGDHAPQPRRTTYLRRTTPCRP